MTLTNRAVIGVLASGRGSNFASLLKKHHEGYFKNLTFACLISNKKSAPALEIARENDIPAYHLSIKEFPDKDEYEKEIVRILKSSGVNWVILAGYMRLIGKPLLEAFPERIINIHPSLLPAFPGLNAQEQAFHYGVKTSGCTVHFVDDGLDSGPIIGQETVSVLETDTAADLSQRILAEEHKLFARCLKRITEENWTLDGRRVIFKS